MGSGTGGTVAVQCGGQRYPGAAPLVPLSPALMGEEVGADVRTRRVDRA